MDFHGFSGSCVSDACWFGGQVRVLEGEVSVLGSHMKQEWKAQGTTNHRPEFVKTHRMPWNVVVRANFQNFEINVCIDTDVVMFQGQRRTLSCLRNNARSTGNWRQANHTF